MDSHLALLHYRNTPVSGIGFSPAEILFSRRLRDDLPRSQESLRPQVINALPSIQRSQHRQKTYCDRTTKSKPEFRPGQSVLVQQRNNWSPTKITEKLQELEDGLRRTSFHLQPTDAEREDNPRVEERPESEPLEQTPIPTGTELEIEDGYVDKQSSTRCQTKSEAFNKTEEEA